MYVSAQDYFGAFMERSYSKLTVYFKATFFEDKMLAIKREVRTIFTNSA